MSESDNFPVRPHETNLKDGILPTSPIDTASKALQIQKLQTLGLLAAGIAHDFTNLMTAIVSSTNRSFELLENGSLARRQIEDIRRAGERGISLARQLLAFRQESSPEFTLVNLNEIVGEMTGMFQTLIGLDNILTKAFEGQPLLVRVDRTQIEQVLVNLVVNARDAMPHNGEVSIHTKLVLLDNDSAAALTVRPGNYALITVTDTGTGISEDVQSRIFEPFFTTKKPSQGTGLGLSTVRAIINLHGGQIRVVSELDRGSSFELLLPLAESAKEQRAKQGRDSTQSAATPLYLAGSTKHDFVIRRTHEPRTSVKTLTRILIVDDEPGVREVINDLLCHEYEVVEASSAQEALEIVGQFYPDIVLLDITMGGMSGLEMLPHLFERMPSVMVIMVSGMQSMGSAINSMRLGAFDYIMKPFDLRQLEAAVKRAEDYGALKERARRQKDFLSVVSHELRAPLQAPLRHSENLLSGGHGSLSDKQHVVLQRIVKGIRTEVQLVNNLLDLQYLDAGRFSVDLSRISLRDLVDEVIESFSLQAQNNHIHLIWKPSINTFEILGDEDKLKQAISNLLKNALDHTPTNKSVTVRLFSHSRATCCIVRDQGVGIPLPYREQIFEQTFQVPTRLKKGLGIGLFITREVIRAHHGEIRVRSRAGKGSVFLITLPTETTE